MWYSRETQELSSDPSPKMSERISAAISGGVQNGVKPLDSASMAPVLPGVFELRDDDKDSWYRVLYVKLEGVVYILHCFRKKTNQTPLKDINTARARLSALKVRLAAHKAKRKSG
jgi:phage-related protein